MDEFLSVGQFVYFEDENKPSRWLGKNYEYVIAQISAITEDGTLIVNTGSAFIVKEVQKVKPIKKNNTVEIRYSHQTSDK